MARKQSDYLAALLSEDEEVAPSPAGETQTRSEARTERSRGTTLLGRESALARVTSGEVRQVTQLLQRRVCSADLVQPAEQQRQRVARRVGSARRA